MDNIYTTRLNCRICGGSLKDVLDLGDIYLNNFVDDGTAIYKAPLTLTVCTHKECELVQLKHTADLDKLYRQYWYQSGLNKGMIASLQDVVNDIMDHISLLPGDIIIDIGANDGTMLSQFPPNMYKVGFDPALNLKSIVGQRCNRFYNTYFDADLYLADHPDPWLAMVITSIAMFYDLEDPNKFVEDIKRCLGEDGVWVIQLTDLISMLKANAFDAVCHEHLEYYSLKTICYLMGQHELEVYDVSTNGVNGGSIRVWVARKGLRKIEDSVSQHLLDEQTYLQSFEDPFVAFANRVAKEKEDLISMLQILKKQEKSVYVLGASTKGNTLLQYYNINSNLIPYAAEVNADKFGLKTVGTNLMIISELEAIAKQPDYFLILPWHFGQGIITNVRKAGYKGKFILPLPKVSVI